MFFFDIDFVLNYYIHIFPIYFPSSFKVFYLFIYSFRCCFPPSILFYMARRLLNHTVFIFNLLCTFTFQCSAHQSTRQLAPISSFLFLFQLFSSLCVWGRKISELFIVRKIELILLSVWRLHFASLTLNCFLRFNCVFRQRKKSASLFYE